MKATTVITRNHILTGAANGGVKPGRKNKNEKNSISSMCALVMADVRTCERCGETMSLRELIAHSKNCGNGIHWFEMLPVLSISEERKLARMFANAK